jgi:hypothetical protein
MRALAAAGGKSLSQCSQLGLNSSAMILAPSGSRGVLQTPGLCFLSAAPQRAKAPPQFYLPMHVDPCGLRFHTLLLKRGRLPL